MADQERKEHEDEQEEECSAARLRFTRTSHFINNGAVNLMARLRHLCFIQGINKKALAHKDASRIGHQQPAPIATAIHTATGNSANQPL
jgi:hypothetical protein